MFRSPMDASSDSSASAQSRSSDSPASSDRDSIRVPSRPSDCEASSSYRDSDRDSRSTSLCSRSRYQLEFEEIKILGGGSYGFVVLCQHLLDARKYAIKKVPIKEESDSSSTLIEDIERETLREVKILAKLSHQCVVRYYQAWIERGYMNISANLCSESLGSVLSGSWDSEEERKILYIQMEACDESLRKFLDENYTFNKEQAWRMLYQILEGLEYIHNEGTIHCDLNPQNIFLDSSMNIKIGDFGLAMEQNDNGIMRLSAAKRGNTFYIAPEIKEESPNIDEKVDIYGVGVIFFELCRPYATQSERIVELQKIQETMTLPGEWVNVHAEEANLVKRLLWSAPSERPSAAKLRKELSIEKWLDDLVLTENDEVRERVVQKIFDEGKARMMVEDQSIVQHTLVLDNSFFLPTEIEKKSLDHVVNVATMVFEQHCADRTEQTPMRLFVDRFTNSDSVKLLFDTGDLFELSDDMRMLFAKWISKNEKSFFKRYEVSWRHGRGINCSIPYRFLQGDFDIVGGTDLITNIETIKVTVDVMASFLPLDSFDICLNHTKLLDALWAWMGIDNEVKLSLLASPSMSQLFAPLSEARTSNWPFLKEQLQKDPKITDDIFDKLKLIDDVFCQKADFDLSSFMEIPCVPDDLKKELKDLLGYLSIWNIQGNVYIDALMRPPEKYHSRLFFKVYSGKTLFAAGGRCDELVSEQWSRFHKSDPPGVVGVTISLSNIISRIATAKKPPRNETDMKVLICSRGELGTLEARMRLASELWDANMKAAFVPVEKPTLEEQIEYAIKHGMEFLVIIDEADTCQTGSVEVQDLENKMKKNVKCENLIDFLQQAARTQL